MDSREALTEALDATATIVGSVDASDVSLPTPCSDWDVRELVNHLVGQLWQLEGKLAGQEPRYVAKMGGLPDEDLVGEDPAVAYGDVRDAVLAAASDPEAVQRAGMTLGALTADVVVHGWDLAQAIGQPSPYRDALVEEQLAFVRQGITDDNRAPMFAPAVDIVDDAPAVDRLAAFLGRTPGTTA